jgi:SOS-response transcriptional repressor LexA
MTSHAQPPGADDDNHMLTERQRMVLACVRQSVESRGYPPTQREIASAVGLKSISTVKLSAQDPGEEGVLDSPCRNAAHGRGVIPSSTHSGKIRRG